MNELILAQNYKIFMMTSMIEQDIKTIKKINSIYNKYTKTKKISYLLEIINILNLLANILDIDRAKYCILTYINEDYKGKVGLLIDSLDIIDARFIIDNEESL
jgi:L-amino acid N-acyltransferase YncA